MCTFKQFLGNAVRQKGFADACRTVKEQIVVFHIKILYKVQAFIDDFLDVLAGISAGHAVFHRFGIIMEAEMVKIFRFQDLIQV